MTMVAGARLADGVLIAADCRVTWEAPTGPLHTDDAQKLIKIGSSTMLGYAGDLTTVNYLLPHIYWTLRQPRRRDDAVTVRRSTVSARSPRAITPSLDRPSPLHGCGKRQGTGGSPPS